MKQFDNLVVLGNGTDWCEKSLACLIKRQDVLFINEKMLVDGKVLNMLANIHYSRKLNKIVHLPFKSIWFNQFDHYINKRMNISEDSVVLIYDRNRFAYDEKFLHYLRIKYKGIKLAYIFTNIVKYTAAMELGYLHKLNDWYDVVYAFDPEDAKKYGFAYSPLIYDADPTYDKKSKESKENIVFYVGQAKDRLSGLLSCFEKLKKLGIKTDFHIANVKEADIKYANEITYNQFMTYDQCVDSIQRATCLIDVIQSESTGLTIKTCEAVCYDKKLITTNKHVKEYPFYDSRYIRIVESPDDIDEEFFSRNRDVHYSQDGKNVFSATSFLEKIGKLR